MNYHKYNNFKKNNMIIIEKQEDIEEIIIEAILMIEVITATLKIERKIITKIIIKILTKILTKIIPKKENLDMKMIHMIISKVTEKENLD
jgi:hypothetical protein